MSGSLKPLTMKGLSDLMQDDLTEEAESFSNGSSKQELRPLSDGDCSKKTAVQSKTVEDHPLARRSSTSSNSSFDDNISLSEPKTKAVSETKRTRGSSIGRLRDFIGLPEDELNSEASDGSGYYTSLWHNRGKILTTLKKQAADGVRRNLPSSLSHSSGFETSDQGQASESRGQQTKPKLEHSGLIKVETGSITESKDDSDMSSFLHGIRDKVVDPLQLIYNKKKEEDERRDELEEFAYQHYDAKGEKSNHHSSTTDNHARSHRQNEPSSLQKISGELADSLSVSLSGLLGGKREHSADASETGSEKEVDQTNPELSDSLSPKELHLTHDNESDTLNNNIKASQAENTVDAHLSIAADEPSPHLVLSLVLIVYLYWTLPVPDLLRFVVNSFVSGCLFSSLFLCLFVPASKRPVAILPIVLNKAEPTEVPKSVYNPSQPIKGWMNEIDSYDPETYHVSRTHSVFVTLDGTTMRLQTPNKSIPRRSIYDEGSIPVTNVVYQRMIEVGEAKVYLKPDGLVKKRVWSKKYPVVVEIPARHKDTSQGGQEESTLVYLFGRTDRQKEQWFYRIQRCINLAKFNSKKAKLENSKKAKLDKEAEASGDNNSKSAKQMDDWGVIENHYEEETFVATTLCSVETTNVDPLKAYRDYFVHVSRLFPDPNQQAGSPANASAKLARNASGEGGKGTGMTEGEPGLEVAWLNVFVGRIMFDFLRQDLWAKWLSVKIQKKLDKIKLPYFMEELKLTEMNLGSTVPLIHQISLPELNSQGIWLEMEVTYTGSLQMTLKTKMVLTKLGKSKVPLEGEMKSWAKTSAITDSDAEDSAESSDEDESAVSRIVGQVQTAVSRFDGPQIVKDAVRYVGSDSNPPSPGLPSQQQQQQQGPSGHPANSKKWLRFVDSIAKSKYFKKAAETEYIRKKLETVSNTPLLLSVELLEMVGVLCINIPPPPTDRVWYGFKEPPHLLIKAHPKLGDRVVKTSHITDWIENKLQQEFVVSRELTGAAAVASWVWAIAGYRVPKPRGNLGAFLG